MFHLWSDIVQASILSQQLLITGGKVLENNLFYGSPPESYCPKVQSLNRISDKQEALSNSAEGKITFLTRLGKNMKLHFKLFVVVKL